jgi:hypothetical protein
MIDLNRREFAGSILLAALAPVLGIEAMPARHGWWESAVERAGGDLDKLAAALTECVRVQYGDRLGPEDLKTITRQIKTGLTRAEEMRKVELANGDEPDFVFSAASGARV